MGCLGLHRAAPARAVAAVAAALTPGTKKSLSVTATERTWLTKPQAEAPAAVPALVPLVTANNAVAQAPVGRKKLPPVLPAVLTVVPVPFLFGEPIHPSGIVIDIVGTEMSCQGRSCDEHMICGKVLEADVVVRLRKIQLMVEGKEETAITAIWVTDGIDRCRVGFVPRHMVRHAARYDGALAQITRVFSSDPEICGLRHVAIMY